MTETTRSMVARGLAQPTRLDRVLRTAYPQAGRQAVQRLIGAGQVTVNGQTVRLSSWLVRNGDRLALLAEPAAKPAQPVAFDDGWIVAQDDDLLAVNKLAGLLSEPARAPGATNLLDLATARFGPLTLFHRLDRDTSGVVLLTRGGPVNRYLDAAFKAGSVTKEYLAVVASPNRLAAEGVIDARLGPHPDRRDMMAVVLRGGQRAVTRYEIIAEHSGHQWVRLWPETGRTHQLRVHLASLDAPILGDRLYNPAWQQHMRLMLHALRITLPAVDDWPERAFTAPLPADFPPFALPSPLWPVSDRATPRNAQGGANSGAPPERGDTPDRVGDRPARARGQTSPREGWAHLPVRRESPMHLPELAIRPSAARIGLHTAARSQSRRRTYRRFA